jgi:hypothetical protein
VWENDWNSKKCIKKVPREPPQGTKTQNIIN